MVPTTWPPGLIFKEDSNCRAVKLKGLLYACPFPGGAWKMFTLKFTVDEMYIMVQSNVWQSPGRIHQSFQTFFGGGKGLCLTQERFMSQESWFSRNTSSELFFINSSLGRKGCKKIPSSWTMDLLLKAHIKSLDPLSTVCYYTSHLWRSSDIVHTIGNSLWIEVI